MMIVREAQQRDVERLIEFLREAWREAGPGAHGWTGATEETVQRLASHGFLSDLLGRDDTRGFIALHDERVVGFSSNRRVSDELVELSGIIVLESMTGVGVSNRLLNHSIEAARGSGCEAMMVKTELQRESHKLLPEPRIHSRSRHGRRRRGLQGGALEARSSTIGGQFSP